ncbi:general odorant-binding protein 56a-like [Danaus plexippus]|uniref:Sericotropin n=1 Tax=Danaus plexippus plexippus TaxID=278856 RepID=A0A212EXE2_DANPL|nr:general odorant-binding protein 56a-like [Danaus plexippus]OWR46117.1 sericotropin [Danaus plexippus plexippus]
MKTFIVLAAILVAAQALTDEQKQKLNKHKSECLAEFKPDEQLVEKLKAGDFKTENEPLKKYVLCMLMKSELMTKEGKFKKDVALAKVPNPEDKPAVEKLIDACLANKGNTPQQTAWNYAKCYHEKDPNHSIFQ